jgi:hypothetical protein
MAITPMLGEWEIPHIEKITALERRRLVPLSVPGLQGTLHQDLGTESIAVEIFGSLHEEELRDEFFTNVREQFNAGEPVSFVADIVTATELEQVLIEDLQISELNDYVDRVRYRIVLHQYVEPPEPASGFDDLGMDLGLDTELDLLADLGLDAFELPGLLVDIPTLGNPVEPILPALDGVSSATEPVNSLLSGLKAKFE